MQVRPRISFWRLWLALGPLLCAAACAHHAAGGNVLPLDVLYPTWVQLGSGAQAEGGQRAFVGVGQVDGLRNVALARATADNRARAELARVVATFVAGLLTQASQQVAPGVRGAAAGAADDALAKAMLAALLPSVQVVDHWFHPDRGAVFSLARLEVEDVHDALARLHDVPEALVTALLNNVEPVHAGMLAHEPLGPRGPQAPPQAPLTR